MMEAGNHFSDVIEVKGSFAGVRAWDRVAGPTRTELLDLLDDFDWTELSTARLAKLFAVATAKGRS
jgi:hypothetical protein